MLKNFVKKTLNAAIASCFGPLFDWSIRPLRHATHVVAILNFYTVANANFIQ